MFGSSEYFLLLSIAAMMSMVSTQVICLDPEALIYCDSNLDHNSKLLDEIEYSVNCDHSAAFNIREVTFLCSVGKLEYIPQNVLSKFTAAEIIDVSYDWLETVKMEDFRENGNIKQLHLQYNQLVQLPGYLFNYTPKIELADFNHNKIETIDRNTFAVGVDYLKVINLSGNQIKALDGRTFMNAISLRDINLEFNQMEHIGLRLVKVDETRLLDSYDNSTLNCMVLPLKNSKYLRVNFTQFIVKTNSTMNEIEIDCDTAHPYLISKKRYLDIDGVKVAVAY